MNTALLLILLLSPFAGFLINLFFGKKLKPYSGVIGTTTVSISFVVSLMFLVQLIQSGKAIDIHLFDWIWGGKSFIGMDFLIDQLSALWAVFVTGVGALIHLYSIGYMHDDENKDRFFAYMNLFIGFMLLLVAGRNLLVTFIGWEGVGLCSYLLIGFWYKNGNYNDAAKKAFIMNRIGDLGFLVAIFVLLYFFGTLDYTQMKLGFNNGTISIPIVFLTVAGLGLFFAATGKSAQIPLYTWLPDAMAGPTPVSALIHAATMVTGGVFLITRMSFLFDALPEVRLIIAIIGALTALIAATIGLMQNDIKKVLAYSTISQLGLMFIALGAGAYIAAVFHVITHAFFKACLFLGAGSVIHGLQGEQDMRRMGKVKTAMFTTYVTFFVATLAISGIPPFSGFFSKDEILLSVFHYNISLWVIASIASLMTSFYMFRALFLTFFGEFRGAAEQEKQIHESPKSMTRPLVVLAALAAVGGIISIPGASFLNGFLQPVLPQASEHAMGSTEYMLIAFAILFALLGWYLAYTMYIKKKKIPVADDKKEGVGKIIYNKFYIDELYDIVFVKGIYKLSYAFTQWFETAISGVVFGIGRATGYIATQARLLQNGNIGLYLVVFVFSLCFLIAYLFIVN